MISLSPVDSVSLEEKLHRVNALNVIFQVTDLCVLACRYCFAKGSHSECGRRDFMVAELLDDAIKQSFETRHDAAVTFEWTGGEAFLAGIDFYRQVVNSQRKHATRNYTNSVQTSGYLLDRKLIDFLVANDFRISLTIDGPEDVHDFNRPAPRGKPSFQQILKTRDYIVEKQGACGAIVTVTKRTLGREGAIIDLFHSLGINSFHSNPYLYFDAHRVNDASIALSAEDYAAYFINQFNAWFDEGVKRPTPITLDYVLRSLAAGGGLPNTLCAFGGKCLTNFVAFAPNGDAYLCPKFIGMESMRLGNITETPLRELLAERAPSMEKLIDQRKSAIDNCAREGCRYLSICNSGCPYHSFIASGGRNIGSRDRLCEGKQMVFGYLESVFAGFKQLSADCQFNSADRFGG